MYQPVVRCVEFVESVTECMEGVLTDDDRVAIEEHLAICPHCTDYLVQLRRTTELLDQHRAEAPPAAARSALLAAFRSQRHDQ